MAGGINQKLKLLYLADIFRRRTDEDHMLTLPEITDLLQENGVEVERKTMYTDFDELRKYGLDIQKEKIGNYSYYHLVNREFETAELKLIIDSIQSAKFITERKSRELIKKIEKLASDFDAQDLQRQVLVAGRVKSMNESVYINVDALHRAINEKKQIRFQYSRWNMKKQLEKRHNGEFFQVTPWALMWDDENYYLVAYDPIADMIKHYRVDKMSNIQEVEGKREGRQLFRDLNTSEYAKQHFGMFTGELKDVELLVDNELIGVMIDRFGKRIRVIPVDENLFRTTVKVAVSPQFIGWILSLGDKVMIISPEEIKEAMKDRIRSIYKLYEGTEER